MHEEVVRLQLYLLTHGCISVTFSRSFSDVGSDSSEVEKWIVSFLETCTINIYV